MPKGTELTEAQKAEKLKEKRANFVRLAQTRLPKIEAAMKQIAQLASSTYSPSDAQKEFVMKQLQAYFTDTAAAFQGKSTTKPTLEVPTE